MICVYLQVLLKDIFSNCCWVGLPCLIATFLQFNLIRSPACTNLAWYSALRVKRPEIKTLTDGVLFIQLFENGVHNVFTYLHDNVFLLVGNSLSRSMDKLCNSKGGNVDPETSYLLYVRK